MEDVALASSFLAKGDANGALLKVDALIAKTPPPLPGSTLSNTVTCLSRHTAAQALAVKAAALLQLERYEEAVVSCNLALLNGGSSPPPAVLRVKAWSLQKLGHLELALEAANQAVDISAAYPDDLACRQCDMHSILSHS